MTVRPGQLEMLARRGLLEIPGLPETLDQLAFRDKQDFKVHRAFKAPLDFKEFRDQLALWEIPEMQDLQEKLVGLAPRATMDPRDLPVLGEKLVLLETQETPDPQDLRELGILARQVYQDLREALDPKVRLALLEMRAKLVKLAHPGLQDQLDRLGKPE